MVTTVFNNDHYLIVDKPPGMLTVPARREHDQTRAVLGLLVQQQLGQQIFPVHRLDFPASGLVLFAKDAEAHRRANQWFELRRVHKLYRALTGTQSFNHIPAEIPHPRAPLSITANQHFEWRGRIKRGKRRAFASAKGHPSITLAIYLDRDPATQWLAWDLEPVTGRPHQLRFDLSWHGFPIIGDELYGSTVDFGRERIALKAYRLDFSDIPAAERFGLPDRIEISPSFAPID